MRIAILEDDPSQAELLTYWLKLGGHTPHPFDRGTRLLEALERQTFDVLLLDWNVPDISGIDVLTRVRQRLRSGVPVLFSTSRNREEDVVRALREGADDFVTKPVRRMELLARLESLARRSQYAEPMSDSFEVGIFRVDCQTRSITRDNVVLQLSAKDFELSVLFLRSVGRLLSRSHILEVVWSSDRAINSRTLDTHVCRVRKKMGLIPEHGWELLAVYGHGYRLEQK